MKKVRSAFNLESLEQRLLFSADSMLLPVDGGAAPTDAAHALREGLTAEAHPREQSEFQEAQTSELIFVDSGVEDYQQLIDDLHSPEDTQQQYAFIVLDSHRDGIDQISDTLKRYTGVTAVHLISHGDDGELHLGNTLLTAENLHQYQEQIKVWQQTLDEQADFLFYSCNLAQGDAGQALLQGLRELTGADIAASDDLTGAASQGGDWTLEYSAGEIETEIAISHARQQSWAGILQNVTVTTGADVVDGDADLSSPSNLAATPGADGQVSLREAVLAANAGNSADVIDLNPGTYSLTLSGAPEDLAVSGDLDIRGSLTIRGADAATTIIDASTLGARIFHVFSSGNVNIENVTILNGNDVNGGGLLSNPGSNVTLTDVIFRGNSANNGGAISNAGNLIVTNVFIDSNSAVNGGGMTNDGSLSLTNVTLDGNQADNHGGGINNSGSLSLNNVTISNNHAGVSGPAGEGGGISNSGSVTSASNVTFAFNSAIDGPAAFGNTIVLTDSIVSQNGPGTVTSIFSADASNKVDDGSDSGSADPTPISPALTGVLIGSDTFKVLQNTPAGFGAQPLSANAIPTFTSFSAAVATTNENTEVAVTLIDLKAQGDEFDSDGTVDAFVVKSVLSGTLRIGANAGSATAWVAGSNDTIGGANNAYWLPALNANGPLAAFAVVAQDNLGAESTSGSVAAQVDVIAVNSAPTMTTIPSNPTFIEGSAAVGLYSGTSVSTIESGQTLSTLILTVGNVSDGASEILNADGRSILLVDGNTGITVTNGLNFSVSVSAGTATVTLSGGLLSTTETETLIDGLSYQNNSADPNTTNRVVTLAGLVDSGGTGGGGNDTASLNIVSTVTVQAVNDAPAGGFDVANVIPAAQISQSVDGSGTITINWKASDTESEPVTLGSFQYSDDGGLSWYVPTNGDLSGAFSTNWNDNGGAGWSSAGDFASAIVHSFSFNTQHADVTTAHSLDNADQNDIKVRFTLNDGTGSSLSPATSENFRVDNLNPTPTITGARYKVGNKLELYGTNFTTVAAAGTDLSLGSYLDWSKFVIDINSDGPDPSDISFSSSDITDAHLNNDGKITIRFTPAKEAELDAAVIVSDMVVVTAGYFSDAFGNVATTDGTVPSPPTAINLNTNETYTEDIPLNFLNDLVVSEPDGGVLTVTMTLSDPAAGTLSTETVGLTTSTFDPITGTWDVTGDIAEVNALLAALTFTPTLNYDSNFTIATLVTDGISLPITGGINVTVNPVNDAPTINGTLSGQTTTDKTTVSPFSGVTIADVDNPAQSLTVSVTLDDAAKGAFSVLNGFADAGGGVYTFSGTAAAATTAIQGLVFAPAENRVAPSLTEATTFTLSVDDGIATAVTDNSTTVISTSVNDAPTIAGTIAGQTVNDNALVSPFAGVTIADVDNPAQVLTVSVTLDSAVKGSFSVLNGFTDAGGGVYSFSGTAVAATTAIQGLVFDPAENRVTPASTETTTFTISVADGVAAPVIDNSTTVISTSVNNAPTIVGTIAGQTVTDKATVSPFSGVTIADVDNPAQSLTVSVTLDDAAKGAFSVLNGFADAGGGVYTFSGTAAAATTAIQGLVFAPAENRVAPAMTEITTFTVIVEDGIAALLTDNTTTVISTSVNDTPTVTSSATPSIKENQTNVLTVTATDVDLPAQAILYSITGGVDLGKFSINGTTGALTFDTAPDFEAPTDVGTDNLYQVEVTADDQNGGAVTQTISVRVTDSTVLDQFTNGDYAENDGPSNWTSDWQEIGETTNPNGGRVRVVGGRLRIGGDEVTINGRGIWREADFSGASSATLSFTYQRQLLDDSGGKIRLAVSADGVSWDTLKVYNLVGTDAVPIVENFDVSAYISANMQVRFLGSGAEVSSYFYLDDVEIKDGMILNRAPVIVSDGGLDTASLNVAENTSFVTDVDAADPEGDTPTYSISGGADAAMFNIAGNGVLTFKAAPNFEAPTDTDLDNVYEVEVTATDSLGSVDSQLIQVTLTDSNEQPTIAGTKPDQLVNDNATISPFADVSIGDVDNPGQILTVVVSLDDAAKGRFATLNGFADNLDGTYTYSGQAADATTAIRGLVYDPTDNRVAVGDFEVTLMEVRVDDGISTVFDTVTSVVAKSINENPTAANDSLSVTEDNRLTIVSLPDLLVNDGDAEGTILSLTGFSQPAHGSLTDNGDGTLSYIPDSNYYGSDSFDYTISDAHGGTATGKAFIAVSPVGDTPQVSNVSTQPGVPSDLIKIIPHADDGAEVTHFRISGITNGTLHLADGVTRVNNGGFITVAQGSAGLRFTPAENATTEGSFKVESSQDGIGVAAQSGTAVATITVTVLPTEIEIPAEAPADVVEEETATETSEESTEEVAETAAAPDKLIPKLKAQPAPATHRVMPVLHKLDNHLPADHFGRELARTLDDDSGSSRVMKIPLDKNSLVQLSTALDSLDVATLSQETYQLVRSTLDAIQEELTEDLRAEQTVVASAIATSIGLSAGYVVWLLQGGTLLTSVLASMPAWQLADPLSILAGHRSDDDEDDDSLEKIIEEGSNDDEDELPPETGDST